MQWVQYFLQGGPLMWPLALCSLVSLAVILERFIALRENMVAPPEFLDEVGGLILEEKPEEALELCRRTWQPVARIVESALERRTLPREWISDAILNTGKEEAVHLEKNLDILSMVASVSPLIGLLGTVTGMIQVFRKIAEQGLGNAPALSGGISEALITTAAGLMVGIPSLIAYHYLFGRAQRLIGQMERFSVDLLEILSLQHAPREARSGKPLPTRKP